MVLGVLERKPEVRRIKINTLSADKNMAQLASDIVDKCKYIHPSRVEEVEQLLLKLRKFSLANESKMDDSSAADSTSNREREKGDRDRGDRDRNDRDRGDRDRGDGERKRSSEARQGGIASGQNSGGGRGRGRDDEDNRRDRDAAPRPVVDPLPPAYMNNLDDYLEMLYQVSGKSEKEREEGLKLQVRSVTWLCFCFIRVHEVLRK